MSFTTFGPFITGLAVTAVQWNGIDTNQSRAIDGTNGGSYSLASPLTLNGAGVQVGADGGVGFTLVRRTGPLTLATATATTAYRIDTTTLGDAAHDVTIAQDTWIDNVTMTAQRTMTARHTLAGVIPVAGNCMTITNAGLGASAMLIKRESGTTIVSLPASLWCSATLIFDATNWRLFWASAGATPGAGA